MMPLLVRPTSQITNCRHVVLIHTVACISQIQSLVTRCPLQAEYISSSHGGTYISATHSIHWTYTSAGGGLPDVIPVVNGCGLTVDLRVLYHPDGPDRIPGNADDPIAGQTITNTMVLEGTPEDEYYPISMGVGTGAVLRDPYFVDAAGKSASTPSSYTGFGIQELPGGEVYYGLSYTNDGTITSTNVIVTDTIPANLIVTSIDVQPGDEPVMGYYEVSNAPGVWTAFPGNS